MNEFPIIGKWYKVIHSRHFGFIGECVSHDINSELPIILQDLEFNSVAVRPIEIKETMRQPTPAEIINRDEFN